MNKRLILAIALSFLVMLIWARLVQKFYPIETERVTTKKPELPTPSFLEEEKRPETLVSTISHGREFVFSLPTASLKKVSFLKFGDYVFNLGPGFCLGWEDLVFTQEKLTSEEAIFIHQDKEKRITKHFDYSDPNLGILLKIKAENLSTQSLTYPSGLILGELYLNSKGFDSRFKEIFIKQPDKILRLSPSSESRIRYNGEFFGFRDRYFCAIIIPISFPEGLGINRINRIKSELTLSLPTINVQPNQVGDLKYRIYLGPQKVELLRLFKEGAEEIIYYGFFDPIAKLLLNILRLFYRLAHNWGWAIVILSIFIYFFLFPLSLKQMRSMKQMQALQPKIEELRRTYKDNPQRLNKEVLELYRRHKINPLGGCFPMLLQIPVFFSLYQALIRSIELRGANFLWIKDLSQPDRLITSPEINILPILMAITMFLQQKFSMMPATGSSSEQQRLMSILFPVLFGVIFYRMPSGLVLYWFINTLLMFGYQTRIKLANEPVNH